MRVFEEVAGIWSVAAVMSVIVCFTLVFWDLEAACFGDCLGLMQTLVYDIGGRIAWLWRIRNLLRWTDEGFPVRVFSQ